MLIQKFTVTEATLKAKSIFRVIVGTFGFSILVSLTGALFGFITAQEWFRTTIEATVREVAAVPAPFILKLYAAITALFFFAVRGYFPKIYGGIEIVVGLLAIFYTADKIPEAVPEALPLLTGIYIMIRGLDNIAKNLKRDKWPIEVSNLLFNQPILTKEEKEVFLRRRLLKYAKKGA